MPRSRNTEGAIYMSMAMAGFFLQRRTLQIGHFAYMNAGQIMFLRGLFTSILVYLIARKMGALAVLASRPETDGHRSRVVCEMLAAVTYITALGMMPIANASAILQSLPLVVTFGAALFFSEPVGWRRWSAILVGLIGVMIIIRPGPEGFTAAALLCVGSVAHHGRPRPRHPRHRPEIPSLMITRRHRRLGDDRRRLADRRCLAAGSRSALDIALASVTRGRSGADRLPVGDHGHANRRNLLRGALPLYEPDLLDIAGLLLLCRTA